MHPVERTAQHIVEVCVALATDSCTAKVAPNLLFELSKFSKFPLLPRVAKLFAGQRRSREGGEGVRPSTGRVNKII